MGVASAMVTQLGMSEVVGQRIVGQQQGGSGPFMGRDFMGGGAPPVSQNLKEQVDAQYERGMHLLSSNMYILDGLAKELLDQEKVGGEQLIKLINDAAAQGKLVMSDQRMAMAAFAGEREVES